MTAIIDDIKLRKVVNKVLSAPERDIVEKISSQDVQESSSGFFAILNECIYNDLETNFKGLFTDEDCSVPYSSDNYTLNVESAVIQFTSRPPTLWAKYLPGGSIIWAEDINNLITAVKAVDNNVFYKDGSIMMTGNLNMGGQNIINSGTVNNINLTTHQHLGVDVDGTTKLTDDSISDLSMSKITGLQDALDTKQDNLPTQTGNNGKFLTTDGTIISWGSPYTRNIGELVQSVIPLTDPKLHLLDGSVLSSNLYPELYNGLRLNPNTSLATYPDGIKIVGDLQNTTNNVWSGFSSSNYAIIPKVFCPLNQEWEVQIKFDYVRSDDEQNIVASMPRSSSEFTYNVYLRGTASRKQFAMSLSCPKTDGTIYNATHYSDGVFSATNKARYLTYGYKNSKLYLAMSDRSGTPSHYDFNDSVPGLIFPYFSTLKLGVSKNLNSYPLLGGVYIDECYLKIGNTIVWQGGNYLSQMEGAFLTDEDTWQKYNTYYGTCGKFVLDTTNNTVRLPNSIGILEGTTSNTEVSNIVAAGLPNITGSPILGEASSSWSKMPPVSGAIYRASEGANKYAGASDSDNDYLAFDASLSNGIYGRYDTVQPQTTKVLHYMVVSK